MGEAELGAFLASGVIVRTTADPVTAARELDDLLVHARAIIAAVGEDLAR